MIVKTNSPSSNNINSEISNFLISYREKNKLSQGQLAFRAGVPQQVISSLESGLHNVTVSTLSRIIDNLSANARLTISEGIRG